MLRRLTILLIGIQLFSLVHPLRSQSPAPDPAHRYRVIPIKKFKDLQRELEQAAAAGDRFVWGSDSADILIMETSPDPSLRREYLLKGWNEAELKEAGQAGFRLISNDLNTPHLIFEKASESQAKYDYIMLKTNRTLALEREMAEAASRGYRVARVGLGMTYIAIMEKLLSGAPNFSEVARPGGNIKLLATERFSTLQKELAEQAAGGYQVRFGFLAGEILLVLEKTRDEKDRLEYLIVAEDKKGTLAKEINDAASLGFRLVPLATMTAGVSDVISFAVMEKDHSRQSSYEYLVIRPKKASQSAQEIFDASAKGYHLATVSQGESSGYWFSPIFIFERVRAN